MQKITKRFKELTNLEQHFFNVYINTIASGGTYRPIERLLELVDDLRTTPKKKQAHELAVMTDILRRLASPRSIDVDWSDSLYEIPNEK